MIQSNRPRILIIDDDRETQSLWKDMLTLMGLELVSVFTLTEAEQQLSRIQEFEVIAVDACMSGNTPDTVPLVTKLRERFNGIMIAISNLPDFQAALIRAGCNFGCAKFDLHEKLPECLPSLVAA